jgi:flavodoxin I
MLPFENYQVLPLQTIYRIIYKANNNISETMTDISVLVDSRGGNTRNVADAIAEEMGITAKDVSQASTDDAKTLFLGSGTYGGKPGEAMMKFIESGNFSGRKVAIFGTSVSLAGGQKMITVMTDALTKKGATIAGAYHCRGKMFLINRGHPDNEDLENAKKFARMMKKE